jgi:hypothetical protein
MNGKSPTILTAPPFVLRCSKDERRVFQQNQKSLVLWKDRKPDPGETCTMEPFPGWIV